MIICVISVIHQDSKQGVSVKNLLAYLGVRVAKPLKLSDVLMVVTLC